MTSRRGFISRVFQSLRQDRRARSVEQEELANVVADGLQADMRQDAALKQARTEPRPTCALYPAVAMPAGKTGAGWIGGTPDLPADMPWPELREAPALFLLQIDCSVLPADLWQGAGPRHGWLRLFAVEYSNADDPMLAIWTEDRGKPRQGPVPGAADWFEKIPSLDPAFLDTVRWPLTLDRPGAGSVDPMQGGFQAYRNLSDMDLSDPPFRPFDAATVQRLLAVLREDLMRWQNSAQGWRQNQPELSAADETYLAAYAPRIQHCIDAFDKVAARATGRLETDPSPTAMIADLLSDLAAIEVPRFGKEEVKADFDEVLTPLTIAPPRSRSAWPQKWRGILYEHAKRAYVSDPDVLSDAQRDFFESVWAEDSTASEVTLGAVPRGFVRVDLAEDAEDVILMELPSSKLLNWSWGDLDFLVITMPREDLEANRFDRLTGILTNG